MPPRTLTDSLDSIKKQAQDIQSGISSLSTSASVPSVVSSLSDPSNFQSEQNTIMQNYNERKQLAGTAGETERSLIKSDSEQAIQQEQTKSKEQLDSQLEGARGFGTSAVFMKQYEDSTKKRLNDLSQRRDELLLQSKHDEATRVDNLINQEQTALTTARTTFVDNFFKLQAENRAKQSFETPVQKTERELKTSMGNEIRTLSANAPSAGILQTDDYNTAIQKYRLSTEYKQNIRKGEADIANVEASAANSRANARKTLSEIGDGAVTNYNGEFAATVDLVSQAGGNTNQNRSVIANNMKKFIGNGDYGSAYALVSQSVAEKLKGTAGNRFNEQSNALNVITDLESAIKAYSASGGNMNIFKGTEDKIQTKIGALYTDPKYAALATHLDSAFQNYRLQMTGAAFGEQESAEYASVLPAKGNTMDLNLAKIAGAKAYLNSSVDSSIKNVVGVGGVNIKDRAFLPTSQNNQPSTMVLNGKVLQLQPNGKYQ